MNEKLMLNLGCGERTHPAWINIDLSRKLAIKGLWLIRLFLRDPVPKNFVNHDLRHGIPYADGVADVAYASHVLEHLKQKDALSFLKEIYRVLKPGGLIRIVVPDLEGAVVQYLDALREVRKNGIGIDELRERHEWATILLLDQMVRTTSGGEMAVWLREHSTSPIVEEMTGVLREIANNKSRFADKSVIGTVVTKLGLRNTAKNGELHRWMYDEISLVCLLNIVGFHEIRRMNYQESRLPEWSSYYLDNNQDGSPHQPGSLWMEAVK